MKPEVTTEQKVKDIFEAMVLLYQMEVVRPVLDKPIGPELSMDFQMAVDFIRARLSDYDALKKTIREQPTEYFKAGRESVLRDNKSGCCCLFNEQDEIVSVCAAHEEREAALKARAEKAEADAKRLRTENQALSGAAELMTDEAEEQKARAEAAESALALAKPLTDTILDADLMVAVSGKVHGFTSKSQEDVLSNALAYRAAVQNAAKGEKE